MLKKLNNTQLQEIFGGFRVFYDIKTKKTIYELPADYIENLEWCGIIFDEKISIDYGYFKCIINDKSLEQNSYKILRTHRGIKSYVSRCLICRHDN